MGLAVSVELPLVDRERPARRTQSTGMPTKVEQADLYQSIFGRNGEAPIPVIACATADGRLRLRRSRPCRIATFST